MASRATNDAVARLREQHAVQQRDLRRRQAAQKRALDAVAAGQAVVEAAERERDAVTARLNEAAADAVQRRDVAVAVLVRLSSSVQDAAVLVGPSLAEVRRAVQRAPDAAVDAQAEQLVAGLSKRRRGSRASVESDLEREGDQLGREARE